jgi:hypothetical protein
VLHQRMQECYSSENESAYPMTYQRSCVVWMILLQTGLLGFTCVMRNVTSSDQDISVENHATGQSEDTGPQWIPEGFYLTVTTRYAKEVTLTLSYVEYKLASLAVS